MRPVRPVAIGLGALVVASLTSLVVPAPVGADGTTSVPVTCRDVPIVESIAAPVSITATDSADPVAAGSAVTTTISAPIPLGDVGFRATVSEARLSIPVPAGVLVDGVTFTASSFPSHTWTLSGSMLQVTLTGPVEVGGPTPAVVPAIKVAARLAGPARTVAWRVPSSIAFDAVAPFPFGAMSVTCTPDAPATTMLTTQVTGANRAPVADDLVLSARPEVARPVTLTGSDPDLDPLTYAVVTPPTKGTLTGTPPNLTYTAAAGSSGPDLVTYSVSDGTLTDTGRVDLAIGGLARPDVPTLGSVTVAEGHVRVPFTPPAYDGGSPITGYRVWVQIGGANGPTYDLPASATEFVTSTAPNGSTYQVLIAAVNAQGDGDGALSAVVTPRWWLPWSSGTAAVDQLHRWFTGAPPTAAQRTSWLTQLGAGPMRTGDLVAALRTGTDATTNVDPTARLYSAFFVRIPDQGGLDYWVARRRSTGLTLNRMASSFAASSEFTNRYGALGNRAFVELVYQNVLGRPGDAGGIGYWTAQLDQRRRTRGEVMVGFSESTEYRRTQQDRVDAAILSIALLGRTPTVAERDALAARLAADEPLATIARDLIRTPTVATRAG